LRISYRTKSSVQQHVKHKFPNNNEDKFRKFGAYTVTCDSKIKIQVTQQEI